MPIFETNDVQLWYDEYGSGDEVVLSSASGFDGYPAVLANGPTNCHVFTIQARGFGRSTHLRAAPEQGWLGQWADDVIAFADHLGVSRFVYTGVSHGGGIGWHLARRHPRRLKALISVVGTPHDRDGDTSSSAGRRAVVENRGNRDVIEKQFRILGGSTDTPERAALREETIASLMRRHLEYSAEEAQINQGMPFPEAKTNEELSAILRTIDVPVLILAGMRDGVISPESALRAARSVPRAKAVLFEDEGHFVARERPERLVAEVAVYLDELTS
ncbi:alpha/beta fold hydrolase [Actinoallomurus iriomotensis]|uniref:Hydrolase n=1 Tax=Actinoallomurus iriomotensis TaxID=478107 RepID=A0A9W6VRV3_9ACTN|nr:alpha/beta hydrolase [Actinoallomurus iriomotensis]GLY78035.1 hydrolase [Actinoallomurus iriomotensis]